MSYQNIHELIKKAIDSLEPIVDLAPEVIEQSDIFAHVSSELDSKVISFIAVDGDETTMTCDELFAGMRVLFSQEFIGMIEDYNKRARAKVIANDIERALLNGEIEPNYGVLFELGKNNERAGYIEAKREETKARIIDTCGYTAWIDACKLYETLSGFERYRI